MNYVIQPMIMFAIITMAMTPPRVPEIKPLGQILRPRNNLLTPSPIRLCPAELGGRGGLSGRHQGELQVRQLFTDYLVVAALDFCHSRLHIRS